MTTIPYLFQPGKSPSERRSFGFDFSAAQEFQYANGVPPQTIVSFEVSCADDALVIEAPVLSGKSNNPTTISAYINGGVAGTTYEVIYQILTNADASIQRTVLLPVNDL